MKKNVVKIEQLKKLQNTVIKLVMVFRYKCR